MTWRGRAIPLVVVGALLGATAVGAWMARRVVDDQDRRLVEVRAGLVSEMVSRSFEGVEGSLRSVGVSMPPPGPDVPRAFETAVAPMLVGQTRAMVLVWFDGATLERQVTVGDGVPDGPLSGDRLALVRRAVATTQLVTGLIVDGSRHRIGLAEGPTLGTPGWIVYRESTLDPFYPSPTKSTRPFADLDVAVYAASDAASGPLVLANTRRVPLDGPTVETPVKVGEDEWLLVARARHPLVGAASSAMPWVIAVAGLLASVLIGVIVEMALRRRDYALALVDRRTSELRATVTELESARDEQRRAQRALASSLERFEALLEASPDAVIVTDAAGTIRHVNGQVRQVFGYAPDELLGRPVEVLVPPARRHAHVLMRAEFLRDPRPRAMGAGADITGLHRSGAEVPLDVSLDTITTDQGVSVTVFARDVSDRLKAEEYARRFHDAEVRRRHALEINDNVVQGMSSVVYALEAGLAGPALEALQHTLASARSMMTNLLSGDEHAPLRAGDLVRDRPPSSMLGVLRPPARPGGTDEDTGGAQPVRVVIADDSEDIRFMLRLVLAEIDGVEVVGEAANGAEALHRVLEVEPDVLLLDLAMPVMDGLEALPLVREQAPWIKVVVLSGFEQRRMERAAIDAGADAYVEKGAASGELADLIMRLARPSATPSSSSA